MKKRFIRIFILFSSLFLLSIPIYSDYFFVNYDENEKYELSVRSNFKVYLNGKYKGLQVNETKGILNVMSLGDGKININGNIYRYKKTIRENLNIGNMIDEIEKCSFILHRTGSITNSTNPSFPPLQGIPSFPEEEIKVGDIYKTFGRAGVTFFDENKVITVSIIPTIKYSGHKAFMGYKYDFFEISYQYGQMISSGNIHKARGFHNLKLYFDQSKMQPVYMEDHFVEEFELNNGDKIKRDGFILYFYKFIVPMNKKLVINDIKKEIDKEILKDIEIKENEEGISITINNLKFKPNSTELLESEKNKIRELALMLKKIKDRSFMIIGHTALAGTEEARMKLSLERAMSITRSLIDNGIDPKKLFYAGKGAKEPIAPNDTEENMKKNRRVEIIILED